MSKETLSNSTEIPKTVLGLEEKYQEENKKSLYGFFLKLQGFHI